MSSSSNEKEKTYLKDPAIPDGEAYNADGTLKDASEIDWIHSPSQLSTAHAGFEDGFGDGNEDILWDDWNLDKNNKPRASVVSNMLSASTSG